MSEATLAQERCLVDEKITVDGTGWLHIERSFDETPVHLAFGELADVIAGAAKYFIPLDMRAKGIVTQATGSLELCRKYGITIGSHGVVDLDALACCVLCACAFKIAGARD